MAGMQFLISLKLFHSKAGITGWATWAGMGKVIVRAQRITDAISASGFPINAPFFFCFMIKGDSNLGAALDSLGRYFWSKEPSVASQKPRHLCVLVQGPRGAIV